MSGIAGSTPRFISPSNDYNRSGGECNVNVNVVSNMSQIANRTNDRIFQVASESPESSELVCSSFYRTAGTPFNFTTSMGGPLFRPRLIQLRHVIFPKIPNINYNNNQMCLQVRSPQNLGSSAYIGNINLINVDVLLDFGYYDPATLASEVNLKLTAAFTNAILGSAYSSFQVVTQVNGLSVVQQHHYDTGRVTLTLKITSIRVAPFDNLPNTSLINNPVYEFWFTNDCSFITRGKNVIDWTQQPRIPLFELTGADPNNPFLVVPFDTARPNNASANGVLTSLLGPGYIYSRFVTIESDAMSLYAYGESRVDRKGAGGGSGKICGVVNTSNYHGAGSQLTFEGMNFISAVDSAALGVKNCQLKMNENIDFTIIDEFGKILDEAFPDDNNWGPTLSFIITY